MAENLKLARPYMIMLGIVAVGRWVQSLRDVPYERATDKFSIVILTLFASVFCAAFARRWRKYTILRAVGLGATLGVIGQLVIFFSTVLSYVLGLHTYFNSPQALNVTAAIPLGEAIGRRFGGLVVNSILNGIAGAIGWTTGGTLPE